jgi:hypothetical protein
VLKFAFSYYVDINNKGSMELSGILEGEYGRKINRSIRGRRQVQKPWFQSWAVVQSFEDHAEVA